MTEMLEREFHLVEGACRGSQKIFPDDWECFPEGVGFESHDDLDVGLAGHGTKFLEVVAKFIFVDDIIWSFELQLFDGFVHYVFWEGER